MKLKLDTTNPLHPVVHFYVDEGSHSCGESRSDWNKVGTTTLKNLLEAAMDLGSGKSKDAYL